MKLALNCTCGAYRRGWLPDFVGASVQLVWAQQHAGPGHAPCTPAVAARARRKVEDENAHRERAKERAI